MWEHIQEWVWLLVRLGLLYILLRTVQGFFRGVANSLKEIATELKRANRIKSYYISFEPSHTIDYDPSKDKG